MNETPSGSLAPQFSYDHPPALVAGDKHETYTPDQQIDHSIHSLVVSVCDLQSVIELGTRTTRDLPEDALFKAGTVLHEAYRALVAWNRGDYEIARAAIQDAQDDLKFVPSGATRGEAKKEAAEVSTASSGDPDERKLRAWPKDADEATKREVRMVNMFRMIHWAEDEELRTIHLATAAMIGLSSRQDLEVQWNGDHD